MAMTIGTRTYNKDRTQPDSIKYVSGSHTISVEDSLTLARSYPKPTATYAGNARPSFKLVRDFTVDGAKKTVIFNGSFQIPVGVANADIAAVVDDVAAFLALAAADDLAQKLDIEA